MENTIKVTWNDLSTREYPVGTRLFEIAADFQKQMEHPIIGAKIDNEVVELTMPLRKDETITFFDCLDLSGYKMYQAGLKIVMVQSLRELFGASTKVVFEHSIDKGIMCTINNGKPIGATEAEAIKKRMQELIAADLPIKKLNISKKEAIEFYENIGESEKAINIRNISNSLVVLYKLKETIGYYYVEMPISTKVLEQFDIEFLEENQIVLMFPSPSTNYVLPKYTNNQLIVDVFKQDKAWVEKIGVKYVADFNEYVANYNVANFVRMNELVFNNKVNNIANNIIKDAARLRLVLIAGPSSSGKTTSTKLLAEFLRAAGFKTLMVSVDDYFKERTETPVDTHGNYDFESLAAIDIPLFNKQLKALVNNESVKMPRYDFLLGKKVYDKKEVTLDNQTIILIEGLHCLNDELTSDIAREVKYKIYLSPFTPLSVDRHNHVSTVDLRLIRRIVRDNRTRGYDVSNTIKNWQAVRAGEEKYIFPYMGEADAVLNTALVYELGVLKVYAEPLLYSVSVTSPYYEEARRLLSFLKSFFPIPSEFVIDSSILREFTGKSIFE